MTTATTKRPRQQRTRHSPPLGQILAEARRITGQSQEAIAKKIGVHRQTITRFERGTLRPSLQTLSQLAEALGQNFLTLVRALAGSKKPNKHR